MIRIIAGKYRHREIQNPDSPLVRPTMDRVREALFSALGNIEDLRVLDLFAGSGAFGFEALSRGAKEVIAVDSLTLSVKAIRATKERLEISDDSLTILKTDYKNALRILGGKAYDLIFADPPYEMNITTSLLDNLENLKLVEEGTRVIIETPEPPPSYPGYNLRVYRYGIRHIGIYRREQ